MLQHRNQGLSLVSDLVSTETMKGSFVLIIDDEPDICRLLQMSLVRLGYDVKYVHELRAGLQCIQSQQPDILFLDIHLPDGSGLEAISVFKNKYPALKVITISAYDNGMEKQTALSAGASHFLAKPFSVKNVDELMKDVKS